MVADDRALAARPPQHGTYRFWNYRVVQWLVFLVFLSVVALVLARKAQEVQALAELTVVKSTVGALRTAMILEHARQQTDRAAATQPACENPFDCLEGLPLQYVGALPLERADTVAPGSWFYDSACPCVGYRLIYPHWLTEPSGRTFIAWRVEPTRGSPTLRPLEAYQWLEERLR